VTTYNFDNKKEYEVWVDLIMLEQKTYNTLCFFY